VNKNQAADFRAGYVAIVGRPNVGKSTLLNRLIGQKISIVSSKPQTTRHSVRAVLTNNHVQYCFVDTPGWQHHKKTALSHQMNQAIMDAFSGVDVVVFVTDAKKLQEIDSKMLLRLPAHLPVILAINKIDQLSDKSRLLLVIEKWADAFNFSEVVPISAEQSIQLDDLLSIIAKHLPVSDPLFDPDELTDQNERFFAAEFIREKVFRLLGDEVPYSAGVLIDQFTIEGNVRKIAATVIVDRPGHKGILIGKHGQKMKRIATDARKEMEKLFKGKVFLEIWVKVKPGWVDDQRSLREVTS
jgi:GTP-binding protein Era